MTRETKVGLLVGLGIILLIGIIVSDHLSIARHQGAANLTGFAAQAQQSIAPSSSDSPSVAPPAIESQPDTTDAPVAQRRTTPLPIPAQASPQPNTPSYDETPTKRPPHQEGRFVQVPRAAVPTLRQTQITQSSGAVTATARPNSVYPPSQTRRRVSAAPQPIIHYVDAGESLWQIAQRYYDNGDYWRSIAQANPKAVQPNGSVREGVRLVIPNKAGLANHLPESPSAYERNVSPAPTGGPARTIEVGAGDSLSSLAKKHLGASDQWPRLFEANRNKLKTADQIRVGMKLKLPASGDNHTNDLPATGHRQTPSPQTYVVQANDSLFTIAGKLLGNSARWEDIYDANRKQLDSPDDIRVGQRLKIPSR